MNRRKVIIFSIFIIAVGVLFLVYYFNRTEVASINQISITKVHNDNKAITIDGCFINSFDGFAKTKVKVNEGNLILTVYKYNILYRGKREGSFKITIDDIPKGIEKIYLTDGKNKKKIADLAKN